MCWPSHWNLEILVKINAATHPTHPSYEGIELAPTSRRATTPQWQTGQRPICVWRLRLLPIFATWSLDCLANGQMQFAPLDMSFVAKESQKIAEGVSVVVHEAWILSHSNMLSAKVQRFDSCKMSTNFSSLKGDEIQTSVFALHWVFSISLVSPNHLQNLKKISPKKQSKEQSKSTVHSLPFGDRQESTIALQSVRCFGTEGRPEISEIQNLGSFLKQVWTSFSTITPIFSHDIFHSDFSVKFHKFEAIPCFVKLVNFLPKHHFHQQRHRKMPEIPPSSEAWHCKFLVMVTASKSSRHLGS